MNDAPDVMLKDYIKFATGFIKAEQAYVRKYMDENGESDIVILAAVLERHIDAIAIAIAQGLLPGDVVVSALATATLRHATILKEKLDALENPDEVPDAEKLPDEPATNTGPAAILDALKGGKI